MSADPTHRHDQFHRGLIPFDQLADGTPADGDVPIYDYGTVTWGPGSSGPDLSGIDFLVGTASGLLSAEIVVGTTPGGDLGNTWASPTVEAVQGVVVTDAGTTGDVLTKTGAATATWSAPTATATAGRLLLDDSHASPIVFDDILQEDDFSDFLYSDT